MKEVIYIPLLNDGTTVSRPALAIHLGGMLYKVLLAPDSCPQDDTEELEFPTGSIVECKNKITRSNEHILIAFRNLEI